MTRKITSTNDQRKVLDADEHGAVFLVRSDGETTHVAFPLADARRMFGDYLRRELQVGLEQADAGRLEPWDIESTIAKARQENSSHSES